MSAVTIYYMRDNHTFRALPLDVEAALKIMRDERDAGNAYGMLCSKMIKDVIHAPSAAEWGDFEERARVWMEAAIKFEVPPTPEAELTRLRARNELYELDAARYRWLRQMIYDDTIIVEPGRMLHGNALDAAIDAARAALAEETKNE